MIWELLFWVFLIFQRGFVRVIPLLKFKAFMADEFFLIYVFNELHFSYDIYNFWTFFWPFLKNLAEVLHIFKTFFLWRAFSNEELLSNVQLDLYQRVYLLSCGQCYKVFLNLPFCFLISHPQFIFIYF